jgi:anti-sigma regulatory factor (Ser/Thr protein kinase)
MYQGRQAAPAQAAGDRHGSRQPTVSAPPAAGRRRRIGLAPVPESARTARAFTVATLRKWHLDALIEDAVVIASELATNAIRHGTPAAMGDAAGGAESGRVELSWCLQASRLICVVTDQAGTPPALAAGGPDAESGHGLQIVGALAVAWGWTILGTGEKAVWAALELSGPADAAVKGAGEAGMGRRAGGGAPAGTAGSASPAAVHDMRAAGRAADPGRLDPAPAVPLCRAAG